MLLYDFIIIAIMLLFNAIFAAYEMGLASVSKARLAVLSGEKRKGSSEALYMKEHMEASLAFIQVGITLVGALAAATGGAGVGDRFAPYLQGTLNMPEAFAKIIAVVIFIIPLTCVIIVFGELVPKMIALNNKEWIVLKLSPVMRSLSAVIAPVISVIEIIVKEVVRFFVRFSPKELSSKGQDLHELKAAVSLARSAKILGAREERIVLAAASFTLRPVKDIIIPAGDISLIWMQDSLAQALIKAHLDMHTRFPVSVKENDPQTIEGYINFKDIITVLRTNPSNPTISSIMRPIKKVPEGMVISQLLETMIQERVHIVLVASDKGKVLGMVTLEDVIEELTGDIESEFDKLPNYVHPYGTTSWIVGGAVPMTTVALTLGLKWEDKFKDVKIPTLAEWLRHKAHKKLIGAEPVEIDGIRILPRKFRRKKLSEAVISLVESAQPAK
ncbi:MAG: CNNM domain-containing protein [Candidatus Omnitrophica bacterium]|nr:CNNM domain-containing protein [Candidatus Omnitrophota bacterium]